MTVPRRALTALIAALGLLLLAGCAPSAEPVPPGLSPAKRLAATRSDLALRWAIVSDGAPGFRQPRVAIVRYTTYRDADETIAACLRGSGYPRSVVRQDGVIDLALTPPEAFPFQVAKFRCESRYPQEPLELGYMTSAQGEYLYDYWSQQTVPCLRSRGVIVPELRPLGASGLGFPPVMGLNPFLKLAAPRGVSRTLLEAECPPFPGELYAPGARVK